MSSRSYLFLIFNRPDTTEKVFEAIRQAKPKKLYIAGDGPRSGVDGEYEKVRKSREIIKKIDWDCKTKFLFRNQNLGCKVAVSSAINWFFEHEDEGLIIEDDCLPNQSFFLFCEKLLEKYRHDERIMAISGNNFQKSQFPTQQSYYFSRYPHIWGWATWKRAWQKWDGELLLWPKVKEKNILNYILGGDNILINYWSNIFEACYRGKIDTWDYQWTYACWLQNGLTIIPKVNLVSNIGFREDATHTVNCNDLHANNPTYNLEFPLQHPLYIVRDAASDLDVEAYLVKEIFKKKHFDLLKSLFLKKWCGLIMFPFTKKRNHIISSREKKRLISCLRYRQTKTVIFGTEIIINDACTLLGDLHEIINKEIYKFKTESENPVIIDCGANIGISVIYFKRLYPEARVIAFEPDPVLFQMLSQNILNFSFENIDLRQEAVWVNNSGVNFLTEGGHSGCITEHSDKEKIVPVASCRLKETLESFNAIDFLKIDIEGAEHDVLFDCGKSLGRCKYIFVEYHSKNGKKQELHNILKLLFDLGYRYHIHEAFKRNHPFVDNDCMVGMDLQLNLFFYKELSQDE